MVLSVRTALGLLLCFAIGEAANANAPSEAIPYSTRKLDAPAAAIVCVHVRVLMRPMIGHSALTIFELGPEKQKGKTLMSKSARWTGYWITKTDDRGNWKGTDFESHPDQSASTFLPFNGTINYFKHFEKLGKNDQAERLCVPATRAELDKLDELINQKKNTLYNPWSNCNDFTSTAMALLTGNEVDLKPRKASTLYCSMPSTMVDHIRQYHAEHPQDPKAVLQYRPLADYEVNLLNKFNEVNRKARGEKAETTPAGSCIR